MTSQRQVVLGIFFVVVLSILGIYTLFLTDLPFLGEKEILQAYFPGANGLRQGDRVMVAGLHTGRVTELVFTGNADPEQRILVTLRLDRPITLNEDFEIRIEESTLLGGRQVNILPGTAAAPPIAIEEGVPLQGAVALNAINRLGTMIERNEASFDEIMSGLASMVRHANAGGGPLGRLLRDEELADDLSRSVASIAGTMENAENLSADLRDGRGTLGKLLADDTLYRRTSQLLDDLTTVSTDLREGRGTVGKLVADEELGEEVDRAIRGTSAIIGQIEAGRGILGRLVQDEAMAADLERAIAALTDDRGSLGALLTSRQLYENVLDASEDVAAIAGALRDGHGSLGRLLMDDEMYAELLISVRLLNRNLEDLREAAPVSALTSVLFGAF